MAWYDYQFDCQIKIGSSRDQIQIHGEVTQDQVANTSEVQIGTIAFYSDHAGISWYDVIGKITVNGNEIVAYDGTIGNGRVYKSKDSGNVYISGSVTQLADLITFTVEHDSSGKPKENLEIKLLPNENAAFTVHKESGSTSGDWVWSGSDAEFSYTLRSIDRSAPTVTASVEVLSETSIRITGDSNWSCTGWQYKLDSAGWISFDKTRVVSNVPVGWHTVQVRAYRTDNEVYGTSGVVSFETSAPTITARLSNPTYSSLDLNATTTAACDTWEYSLDNGENWTQFSTTEGTSASTTLTGLSPNTSYSVLVRARKVSNGLTGTSEAATATTNGGTILTRVNTSAIDVASPSITFIVTAKETLYHKLKIYKNNGTTLVKTITVGTLEVGTGQTVTKAISSTVKNALLNCFPSAKTYDFKITLESFSDSGYQTSLGESGPVVWRGTTSEANSKPTFTTFVYCDTETETVDATGDDQVLIQVASHLLVTATAGTAKNGASISGYSASIGDVSLSGASTTLDVGAVSSSGDLTLRVTCSDTRGYSTSVEKTVKVLPYAKPRFSMFNLRRRNEIEALVQLYFSGSVSSIIPDDVEKNSVVSIQLAWKSTSADDSSYQVIDLTDAAEMTITGLSFNYGNAELMQLDEMSSFNFVFQVIDELGNASVFIYETILNQGTPLLSFRKKTNYLPPRVGINNPEPIHEIDVHGNIAMHDVLIMGFVEDLGTQYISSATFRAGGYYIQSDPTKATTVKGYPVEGKAGMLEIIANPEGIAVQRYTTFNGSSAPAVYIRTYDGETWSAWKVIT